MIHRQIDRREAVTRMAGLAAAVLLPTSGTACQRSEPRPAAQGDPSAVTDQPALAPPSPEDEQRLTDWVAALRREGLDAPDVHFGRSVVRVGELAVGTPYEAYTLEEYIRAGGSPMRSEPLTLSLTRFDCVSLVESCIAVARVARLPSPTPGWADFAREMERMRYRGGQREGYSSRLHYFSDWMTDNESRGLVRVMRDELGAVEDSRPLRFMSEHPESYPALASPEVLAEIVATEVRLDTSPRWLVPRERIPSILPMLEAGDILAFATSIAGLDVTHAAFVYDDSSPGKRVLHAPLSGGVVEVTRTSIPEYVNAIRQATGILVARPLPGPTGDR